MTFGKLCIEKLNKCMAHTLQGSNIYLMHRVVTFQTTQLFISLIDVTALVHYFQDIRALQCASFFCSVSYVFAVNSALALFFGVDVSAYLYLFFRLCIVTQIAALTVSLISSHIGCLIPLAASLLTCSCCHYGTTVSFCQHFSCASTGKTSLYLPAVQPWCS